MRSEAFHQDSNVTSTSESVFGAHCRSCLQFHVFSLHLTVLHVCSSYAFMNYRFMYYNNKHSTMAKSDSNDISGLNQTAGCYNTLNHFDLHTPAKWQDISTFLMD